MAKDTEPSYLFEGRPIDEFEDTYEQDEIINPVYSEDAFLLGIPGPEVKIQIETQKTGSLEENRKERAPNEDVRLLQSYMKEVRGNVYLPLKRESRLRRDQFFSED